MDTPRTLAELIEMAKAAGYDSFGICLDPELQDAINKTIARQESSKGPFTMSKEEYIKFVNGMYQSDDYGA